MVNVIQFRRAPSPEFIMALAEILRRQKNQLALIETVHLVNELKSRSLGDAEDREAQNAIMYGLTTSPARFPGDATRREAVGGLPPFSTPPGEP